MGFDFTVLNGNQRPNNQGWLYRLQCVPNNQLVLLDFWPKVGVEGDIINILIANPNNSNNGTSFDNTATFFQFGQSGDISHRVKTFSPPCIAGVCTLQVKVPPTVTSPVHIRAITPISGVNNNLISISQDVFTPIQEYSWPLVISGDMAAGKCGAVRCGLADADNPRLLPNARYRWFKKAVGTGLPLITPITNAFGSNARLTCTSCFQDAGRSNQFVFIEGVGEFRINRWIDENNVELFDLPRVCETSIGCAATGTVGVYNLPVQAISIGGNDKHEGRSVDIEVAGTYWVLDVNNRRIPATCTTSTNGSCPNRAFIAITESDLFPCALQFNGQQQVPIQIRHSNSLNITNPLNDFTTNPNSEFTVEFLMTPRGIPDDPASVGTIPFQTVIGGPFTFRLYTGRTSSQNLNGFLEGAVTGRAGTAVRLPFALSDGVTYHIVYSRTTLAIDGNLESSRYEFSATPIGQSSTNFLRAAGVIQHAGTSTDIAAIGASRLSFGGNPTVGNTFDPSNRYIGDLRELRIWDRALDSTQTITYRGELLNGEEEHLVAYWRFMEHMSAVDAVGVPNILQATPFLPELEIPYFAGNTNNPHLGVPVCAMIHPKRGAIANISGKEIAPIDQCNVNLFEGILPAFNPGTWRIGQLQVPNGDFQLSDKALGLLHLRYMLATLPQHCLANDPGFTRLILNPDNDITGEVRPYLGTGFDASLPSGLTFSNTPYQVKNLNTANGYSVTWQFQEPASTTIPVLNHLATIRAVSTGAVDFSWLSSYPGQRLISAIVSRGGGCSFTKTVDIYPPFLPVCSVSVAGASRGMYYMSPGKGLYSNKADTEYGGRVFINRCTNEELTVSFTMNATQNAWWCRFGSGVCYSAYNGNATGTTPWSAQSLTAPEIKFLPNATNNDRKCFVYKVLEWNYLTQSIALITVLKDPHPQVSAACVGGVPTIDLGNDLHRASWLSGAGSVATSFAIPDWSSGVPATYTLTKVNQNGCTPAQNAIPLSVNPFQESPYGPIPPFDLYSGSGIASDITLSGISVFNKDINMGRCATCGTGSNPRGYHATLAANSHTFMLNDMSLNLNVASNFTMQEGASIRGICGNWQGIQGRPLSKFSISGTSTSPAIIANAGIALEASSSMGRDVAISGAVFEDNAICIVLPSETTSTATVTTTSILNSQIANVTNFDTLTSTGIQLSANATISNCTFRGLRKAIDIRGAGSAAPTIHANQFYENRVSIDLAPPNDQTVDLDLSCNVFEPGGSPDPAYDADGPGGANPLPYNRHISGNAYGIHVSSSGLITYSTTTTGPDRIALGEVGRFDPAGISLFTFAANVWPAVSRATIPTLSQYDNTPNILESTWSSPPFWTSIFTWGGARYHKYRNEFLGESYGFTTVRIPIGSANKYVLEDGQARPAGILENQLDRRCSGLPGDPFVVRTSSPSDGNPSARIGEGMASYLLQNIPNPANKETIIGYHIDGKYQNASLEIVELATGKTKQILTLQPSSPKAIVLSLKNYSIGLYGYKLIVDGKVLDTKKILVQR